MIIFRKSWLCDAEISERCDKKRVMLKFCLQQNFPGFFIFNLIRRSLEFFNSLASYARDPLIFAMQKRDDGNVKNRDDVFVFGYAKLLAFALVLCLGVAGESWAVTDCPSEQICTKCGDDCWAYLTGTGSDKTLNVIGTGDMYNYGLRTINDKQGLYHTDKNGNVYENLGYANRNDITAINVGKGITSIQSYGFYGLTKASNINLPEGITSFGYMAFLSVGNASSSPTNLTLPNSVTTIGNQAFSYMTKLANLTIPDSVETIAYGAFQAAGIRGKLIIPDSVTSIGDVTFYNASKITSLTLPDTLTSIGSYWPFLNMSSLQELIIPDIWADKNNLSLNFNGIPATTKIICQGELAKCQAAMEDFFSPDRIESANSEAQCVGKYIWDQTSEPKCRRMTENECNEVLNSKGRNKYYWTGAECVNRPDDVKKIVCDYQVSGYIKIKDMCVSPENSYAKKRYTPAEAAQWLNEDNNTITLTFKK